MSHYMKIGNVIRVADDSAVEVYDHLPVGNYTVTFNPMMGYYLEQVHDFPDLGKIYGDLPRNIERIFSTYMKRDVSTGALFTGEKGSGKTLMAKALSQRAAKEGIPTLVINSPFTDDGFKKFIQDIDQRCVILFDEFEKVFNSEDQEAVLTLLDGTYPTQKLFVLTCNDKYRIDGHMRNRPGRLFYMIDFASLGEKFVREYCEDNLHNKDNINQLVSLSNVFAKFNFDMLKAMVEEMNRYNESASEVYGIMNAKPEDNSQFTFKVEMTVDGNTPNVHDDYQEVECSPLLNDVHLYYLKKVYSDYHKREVDQSVSVILTPQDIVKAEVSKGIIYYELPEKKTRVVLRRIQRMDFDFFKAL